MTWILSSLSGLLLIAAAEGNFVRASSGRTQSTLAGLALFPNHLCQTWSQGPNATKNYCLQAFIFSIVSHQHLDLIPQAQAHTVEVDLCTEMVNIQLLTHIGTTYNLMIVEHYCNFQMCYQ